MPREPKPPKGYEQFIKRYPKLLEAWESCAQAGQVGPLDECTRRLLKLAIAIGSLREGAIRANVRKAQALGIKRQAIEQAVALAASTIGFPATVAVSGWVQDAIGSGKRSKATRKKKS